MKRIFVPGVARRGFARGVSLVFALIGLAVLSLAAIALVRSVDTGALVLGNLGFKQDATRSTDQGAEQALTWLTTVPRTTLYNDVPGSGYRATSFDLVDPTGSNVAYAARWVIDWDGDNCAAHPTTTRAGCVTPVVEGADVNGSRTQFVIFRMCPTEGAPNAAGNDCARPTAYQKPGDVTRGEFNYRKYERLHVRGGTNSETVYYRIIVRTVGGRDAVSFSETMVTY